MRADLLEIIGSCLIRERSQWLLSLSSILTGLNLLDAQLRAQCNYSERERDRYGWISASSRTSLLALW